MLPDHPLSPSFIESSSDRPSKHDKNDKKRKKPNWIFGIAGLDRATLDSACIQFLTNNVHCNLATDAQTFWQRYRAYFALHDRRRSKSNLTTEANSMATSSSLHPRPVPHVKPAPVCYILAAASVGIGHVEDVPDRLDVQRRMAKRLEELAFGTKWHETDHLDLMDTIIAATGLKPLAEAIQKWEANNRDPLKIHPLSHEALVRLVLGARLNENATWTANPRVIKADDSSAVKTVNDPDLIRKVTIFWLTYAIDAFSQLRIGELPLISNERIDASFLPTYFETQLFRDWVNQMSSLAALARDFNVKANSPKAKRVGINPIHVISIVKKVEEFRASLPGSLSWDPYRNKLVGRLEGNLPRLARIAFVNMVLLHFSILIHTFVRIRGFDKDAPHVTSQAASSAAQGLASFSAGRIVSLTEECALLNLLKFSNFIFVRIPLDTVSYLVDQAKEALQLGFSQASSALLTSATRLEAAVSARGFGQVGSTLDPVFNSELVEYEEGQGVLEGDGRMMSGGGDDGDQHQCGDRHTSKTSAEVTITSTLSGLSNLEGPSFPYSTCDIPTLFENAIGFIDEALSADLLQFFD
ncbi:hypothetical protein IE53DRAFT_367227 [Violaceomyces palustris]|uniref:Uncharacterized protein n=1 Tax=Violaceomyces palustris TaxID=1673888 RepID=A0ACD0P334_9BASI|nr:hypothetical protein IE53DRAFT_367227 [Violaceomyces palustris]